MTVTASPVQAASRFSVTGTGLQKAGAIQQDGRNVNPLSKPALKELLICGSTLLHCRDTQLRRKSPSRRDRSSQN